MLFDELDRLSLGRTEAYAQARSLALDWLLRVPMRNDAWSGYFEDIDIQSDPAEEPQSVLGAAHGLVGSCRTGRSIPTGATTSRTS